MLYLYHILLYFETILFGSEWSELFPWRLARCVRFFTENISQVFEFHRQALFQMNKFRTLLATELRFY